MNDLPPCKLCKSEPLRVAGSSDMYWHEPFVECPINSDGITYTKDQWIKLHGIVYQDLVEGLKKEFLNYKWVSVEFKHDGGKICLGASKPEYWGKDGRGQQRDHETLDQAIAALKERDSEQ